MSWNQSPFELLEWILRLASRAIWALITIVLSIFFLYLALRLVGHTIDLLNRTLFNGPW